MTAQADFTEEEWKLIIEAPPGAGLVVALSSRGGSFRESFSMAKTYVEVREQAGASELLDAIVSTKPKLDHSHKGSFPEVEEYRLAQLGKAVETLAGKATPEEVDDYKKFVVTLAQHVAEAHKEHGQEVSDAEAAAIEKIRGDARHPGRLGANALGDGLAAARKSELHHRRGTVRAASENVSLEMELGSVVTFYGLEP